MNQHEFDEFAAHVATNDRDTEGECQRSLHFAQAILFPVTVTTFVRLTTEERSYYGRSDFCVTADIQADNGDMVRTLSIWELKSPQSIIMEADDNHSRWRPSRGLIKAETQLLHYLYTARLDGALHRRYGVLPENIMSGGIVMGRHDTWCAATGDQASAKLSHSIRSEAFYRPSGIRFLTWSRVIDFVRPIPITQIDKSGGQ
jgi:hypothetical protein